MLTTSALSLSLNAFASPPLALLWPGLPRAARAIAHDVFGWRRGDCVCHDHDDIHAHDQDHDDDHQGDHRHRAGRRQGVSEASEEPREVHESRSRSSRCNQQAQQLKKVDEEAEAAGGEDGPRLLLQLNQLHNDLSKAESGTERGSNTGGPT